MTSPGCWSGRPTTGSTSAPGSSVAPCGWSPPPGRSRWSSTHRARPGGRAAGPRGQRAGGRQRRPDRRAASGGAAGRGRHGPRARRRGRPATRPSTRRTPSGASTLLVTTIRPGDGLAATDRTAVTTDGDLVYAAEDRLYVATSRWGTVGPAVRGRRHERCGRPVAPGRGPDRDARLRHDLGHRDRVRRQRLGAGLRAGPVGAVALRRRPAGGHHPAAAVGRHRPRRLTSTAPRRPRWWSSWPSGTARWSRRDGSPAWARASRSGRCATSATSRRS